MIKGTHMQSCKTKKGSSAPEKFLGKGLRSFNVSTLAKRPLYGRKHLQVQLMVDLHRQRTVNREEESR